MEPLKKDESKAILVKKEPNENCRNVNVRLVILLPKNVFFRGFICIRRYTIKFSKKKNGVGNTSSFLSLHKFSFYTSFAIWLSDCPQDGILKVT